MKKIIFLWICFSLSLMGEGRTEVMVNNDNTPRELLNNRLSPSQLDIIEHSGTEAPWTGELLENHVEGTYICTRCKAPLYLSDSKFNSESGWPSFDDEIDGAVTRQSDGFRTEIICNSCGAHLGHVFDNEGFTAKNTRHCVNSQSLEFVPAQGEVGRAVFAGGCFWGVEHLYKSLEGVVDTTVGYSGGNLAYPTYRDVLGHDTGHYEVIEVVYDTSIIDFESIAKFFFEIHDPTQTDGQGPDIGEQYLSVVFYQNETQREITENLIEQLEEKGYDIATQFKPSVAFWPAEVYHQDYYELKGTQPYCHSYTKRF
ncbi:MAG: bifunctional methionine sulfoxide reductase B/A protein [Spirochaetaceae bacterium]|nr:bifunctional methionine sulfoxide reductase B/A protein [Spirochaetaceae bacterium]